MRVTIVATSERWMVVSGLKLPAHRSREHAGVIQAEHGGGVGGIRRHVREGGDAVDGRQGLSGEGGGQDAGELGPGGRGGVVT